MIDPLAEMAAANPVSAAELAAGMRGVDLERELARAAALGRVPSEPIAVGDRAATRRSRAALGLGLAAVVVLAAILVFSGWLGGSGGSRPEFASAAIEVAEANPRLLITAPGWEIVRADEFEPDSGELTFSDGAHDFDLHWYPARQYEEYLRDRGTVSTPEHGTLLGQRATTVDYTREEYATMLSPQGRSSSSSAAGSAAKRPTTRSCTLCGRSTSIPGSARCRRARFDRKHALRRSRGCCAGSRCRRASTPRR